MNFERAMLQFKVHLRAERNVSDHTVRSYLSDVRQFAAFAVPTPPAEVTASILRSYLAGLNIKRAVVKEIDIHE